MDGLINNLKDLANKDYGGAITSTHGRNAVRESRLAIVDALVALRVVDGGEVDVGEVWDEEYTEAFGGDPASEPTRLFRVDAIDAWLAE